jgi:orotate phosphoribosyltransferase-like protein
VLQLMARGKTNKAIAETLVISEGTAKYHVKNVLRKLQATSRADAVARCLRATRRAASAPSRSARRTSATARAAARARTPM